MGLRRPRIAEEGNPLNQQSAPAARGVSRIEELEVVGLLQERIDRLVEKEESPRNNAK
jgi:hypothetical protein